MPSSTDLGLFGAALETFGFLFVMLILVVASWSTVLLASRLVIIFCSERKVRKRCQDVMDHVNNTVSTIQSLEARLQSSERRNEEMAAVLRDALAAGDHMSQALYSDECTVPWDDDVRQRIIAALPEARLSGATTTPVQPPGTAT